MYNVHLLQPGAWETIIMGLTYTVLLVPEPEGGFSVEVPALPGCFSRGKTISDALRNAEEAILCYLGSLLDDGEAVPEETGPVSIDAGGITEALVLKVSVVLDESTEARVA